MAFFDKLNQVAKNLGDKTTDAIETTKLNTKIHTERNAAAEEFKKIGEYYYNVYICICFLLLLFSLSRGKNLQIRN